MHSWYYNIPTSILKRGRKTQSIIKKIAIKKNRTPGSPGTDMPNPPLKKGSGIHLIIKKIIIKKNSTPGSPGTDMPNPPLPALG